MPFAGLLVIAACAVTAVFAHDGIDTSELTIHAVGFKHARGHAVAKLFAPGDNVLGRGQWEATATIDADAAVFHFPALGMGRYAVVVFHDENDNGVIDHRLLGPSEPIGFSGGFVLSLISGRPNFEQLCFTLGSPAQTLEIKVR